ncbi:alpha-ketoglutarate-dependent dioxygenase AlkB [Variovorax paradoxus]|nr:alpha-ketoglutarate-dependent dioxygenase AlkB [Variovorax paradoxus]
MSCGAAVQQQQQLFEDQQAALHGWVYETGFLSAEEEAVLLDIVRALPLYEMRYKNFVARRRGMSFGGHYDFDANRLQPSPPLPASLAPLRAKVAAWLNVRPEAFTHVLVAEYRPGSPLGWHRDVPDFEDVVGVSLLGEAILEFRRYPPRPLRGGPMGGRLQLRIAPRSIYLMRGPARWQWQHSVKPTQALRYSITLRTPRGKPLAGETLKGSSS